MLTKTKHILLLTLTLLYWLCSVQAQPQKAPAGKSFSGSIENQFDILLKSAYPYESFKSIRDDLPFFKKNTLDTLSYLQKQIKKQKLAIESQETSIDSLKLALVKKHEVLLEKNNTSFLGITFNRSTYNLIVWGLILILVALLLFFIQRYKSNIHEARESKASAEEIREEFEQHRKKAMEREQKLKRDLQDELNKRNQ